ncbi:hypothetical protein [Cerasicoccus frondis]|uniref:hypothetical protein n=1 Tax=Cerasicoccus frondis TaxID=490090 RepID=UPI0028528ADB|nr:hypothetical protein [Cerasicoccus frondis]
MKLFLKITSWILLVLGMLMLTAPLAALLSIFWEGENFLGLIFILPILVFSVGCLIFSIGYLRTARKSYAEGLAMMSGFIVWGVLVSFTSDWESVDQAHNASWLEMAFIIGPILLGVCATKLLKHLINRSHSLEPTTSVDAQENLG